MSGAVFFDLLVACCCDAVLGIIPTVWCTVALNSVSSLSSAQLSLFVVLALQMTDQRKRNGIFSLATVHHHDCGRTFL